MKERQARRAGGALAVVGALLLGGCAATAPEPVRDPQPVDESLPEVDTSSLRLPFQYEQLDVVDPGWDLPVQYADGVYLSAVTADGILEFTAVDIHGNVLWSAQRPAGNSEFALTTDDQDRALAVLTDSGGTDGGTATTATAYDLHTGDQVWGPVDVPGPPKGPGLVFADPEAADGSGAQGGAPTVLDPSTGEAVATATDARPVGEFHGIVLLADEEALVAQDTDDDEERWRLPLAEQGWSADSLSASPDQLGMGHDLALVGTSGSAQALIDVQDGTVLSDTAQEAAVDAGTDTLVVLDDAGLQAYDPAGQHLWSLSTAEQTTIAAAGGVMLYLREGESVRAHNAVTGAVAEAYDPEGEGVITVPVHVTSFGAAVLTDGERQLLATVPEQVEVEGPPPED